MEFSTKKAVTRKDILLKAIWDLGGLDKGVTTKEIAKLTGFNTNGISQTLGRMNFDVDCLGGRGENTKWKLKGCYAGTLTDQFSRF